MVSSKKSGDEKDQDKTETENIVFDSTSSQAEVKTKHPVAFVSAFFALCAIVLSSILSWLDWFKLRTHKFLEGFFGPSWKRDKWAFVVLQLYVGVFVRGSSGWGEAGG